MIEREFIDAITARNLLIEGKLEEEYVELCARIRKLEAEIANLKGHIDLKHAVIDDLKARMRTLANWHTRSNTCPYPEDYPCPRLKHGMCFASHEIMRECWIDAAKEAIE